MPSRPALECAVDSGVYAGWTVPLEYDPMLAKLIAWADTREHAAARLRRALSEYHVMGIRTNIAFFGELLRDREFLAGQLDTGFLPRYFERRVQPTADMEGEAIARKVLAKAGGGRER